LKVFETYTMPVSTDLYSGTNQDKCWKVITDITF